VKRRGGIEGNRGEQNAGSGRQVEEQEGEMRKEQPDYLEFLERTELKTDMIVDELHKLARGGHHYEGIRTGACQGYRGGSKRDCWRGSLRRVGEELGKGDGRVRE
jgi:hypothetical protein